MWTEWRETVRNVKQAWKEKKTNVKTFYLHIFPGIHFNEMLLVHILRQRKWLLTSWKNWTWLIYLFIWNEKFYKVHGTIAVVFHPVVKSQNIYDRSFFF